MLTATGFRRLALGLPGATEGAHMGHPDFRANGRIFASLHASLDRGMVKLTPEQQAEFVHRDSAAFTPENGAWGLQGCTRVQLDASDEETLGEALTLAWRNTALKPGARRAAPRHAAGSRDPSRKR
jgi:hypothetical protein